jgi:hypothetical protein
MVILLLPKGGDNFWGIGLLNPFWKVVEENHGVLTRHH